MSGGFVDGGSASFAADQLSQFRLAGDAFERQVAIQRFTFLIRTSCLPTTINLLRLIDGLLSRGIHRVVGVVSVVISVVAVVIVITVAAVEKGRRLS